MLTETGRVVAVEDDSLWVETIRQSTCGSCSVQKGCGHGLLNKIGDGRRNLVRVLLDDHNPTLFAVDQSVRIAIPEQVLLKSSFIAYVLPLLLMLVLASWIPSMVSAEYGDLAAAGGAALGLMLGVLLIRLHAWHHRRDPDLQPKLLGLAHPESGVESVQI